MYAFFFFRLEVYLDLIAELASHPLVVTCSEVVPVLLQCYFLAIRNLHENEIYSSLLSAMIDRIGVLYAVPNYSESMKK